MLTHVVANVGPDTEEHALSLVVTSPVTVRFSEVTSDNGAVYCGDNLGQSDGFSAPREDVAPAHTTFRSNEPDTLEAQEDLF
jgi:hypothetical protein